MVWDREHPLLQHTAQQAQELFGSLCWGAPGTQGPVQWLLNQEIIPLGPEDKTLHLRTLKERADHAHAM